MSPLLEVESMSKRFGGVQAVDDVSFSVAESELFAIIGPNGAGKTTLLNLVTGLVPSDEGRVSLDGKDITGAAGPSNASRGMARTLQKAVVFPGMTVVENVMLGHTARRGVSFTGVMLGLPSVRRWERDARAKAVALVERLGLDEYADRPATELPLGLQRLVEIGRALATEPRILLLDEPAAGLAREEVDRLAAVLRDASYSGIAICLVEHNMRLVMGLCSRILVVHQGRRLFEGTPAEIQSHPDVVAAYLGSRRRKESSHAAS